MPRMSASRHHRPGRVRRRREVGGSPPGPGIVPARVKERRADLDELVSRLLEEETLDRADLEGIPARRPARKTA